MRHLEGFFEALASEPRLQMLSLIHKQQISVNYLKEVLRTAQPKISRHLAYLKKARLASSERNGRQVFNHPSKLSKHLGTLLASTLIHLKDKPEVKMDNQRFRQISSSAMFAMFMKNKS